MWKHICCILFTYNNVVGTHVMLEACRLHNIKRFIHVSTDEVYGEQTKDQVYYFSNMRIA